MARFSGAIGYYSGELIEASPGVFKEGIVERTYKGDITRVTRKLDLPDSVNGDIQVNNMISILADPYAFKNFFNIRYILWNGVRWVVNTVEVNRPRLVLYIGSEYHGATPQPTE